MTSPPIFTDRRQKGAALFVSLVAIVVLTIIAITAASSSGLELLMATNSQNATQALVDAEDSLLAGESDILANHNAGTGPSFDFSTANDDGLYNAGEVVIGDVELTGVTREQVLDADGNVVAEYVIEYLGTATASGGSLAVGTGTAAQRRFLYRVTGRGLSDRGSARLVQSIFATR